MWGTAGLRRTEKRMILGITGGVGTGKSTVLAYLKEQYGAFLIQLDDVARQLQQPQEACYGPMLELFGITAEHPDPSRESAGSGSRSAHDTLSCQRSMLLNEDGTFNRSAVAKLVFADDDLRGGLAVRFCDRADRRIVKKRLRIAAPVQREPAFQHRAVLRDVLLHFAALMIGVRFVLKQRGPDRRRVHKAVEIVGLVVVGKPDGLQFSCFHRALQRLIRRHVVSWLAVMQDHQVDIVHAEPLKRCVDGGVAVVKVARPHLRRDKHVLALYDAFLDRTAKTFSNRRLVAVDTGGVDQAEARLQRPVGGVFGLRGRKIEHTEPEDRHFAAAVQGDGLSYLATRVAFLLLLYMKTPGYQWADNQGR